MGDNNGKGVTKSYFETELKKYDNGITVTEDEENNNFKVLFPSGNEYTVDNNGKITGPTNDGTSEGSGSQGVVLEIEVTVGEYNEENQKVTIEIKVTNEVEEVKSIKITNVDTGDTYDVTVNGNGGSIEVDKNGKYKVEVQATIEGTEEKGETTVKVDKIPVNSPKAQGKIDIIWVNTENKKIEEPIVPSTLPSGMKKVYWEEGIEVIEGKNPEFDEKNWYKYEEGNNKTDSKDSKWANVINTAPDGGESYFVWIPRYAYRITYLTAEGQVVGYCDGDGIRDVKETKKEEPKSGIETVEYNGYQYIVHPAFEGNVRNGGWDEDLSGIWVAKYEMSGEKEDGSNVDTSSYSIGNYDIKDEEYSGNIKKIVSKPNVKSWRYITIGNCYLNSYKYDRSKESHLMKNSEWGAVAYLTHSQYGRNSNKVSMNKSSSYITGNGDGTNDSKLSSSTGNEYGIYDLRGGAYEFVATFNYKDDNNYESTCGSSFASPTNASTKYATKYSSESYEPTYESYYPGDATYEVYAGNYNALDGGNAFFTEQYNPFFFRGGYYYYENYSSVFFANRTSGASGKENSFRVILAGLVEN